MSKPRRIGTSPISSSWVVMVRFPAAPRPALQRNVLGSVGSPPEDVQRAAAFQQAGAVDVQAIAVLVGQGEIAHGHDLGRRPRSSARRRRSSPTMRSPLAWTVRSPSGLHLAGIVDVLGRDPGPNRPRRRRWSRAPNTITPVLARSPATVSWLAPRTALDRAGVGEAARRGERQGCRPRCPRLAWR